MTDLKEEIYQTERRLQLLIERLEYANCLNCGKRVRKAQIRQCPLCNESYCDVCEQHNAQKQPLCPKCLKEQKKPKRKRKIPDISEKNRKLILKFYEESITGGKRNKTATLHWVKNLIDLAELFDKDFKRQTSKKDIINLLEKIENKKSWGHLTKCRHKTALKYFYKWLYKMPGKEYPKEVSWFTVNDRKFRKMPEKILVEEEIRQMIAVARNARDGALIFVLYESGCRIGELLTLQIKNINYDVHGATLLVDGKTGQRVVRIVHSVPALKKWINEHPKKNNPEWPVWISDDINMRVLSFQRVRSILKAMGQRAGIKKPVNPHNFRRSLATTLSSKLTDCDMCDHLGWVPGSSMVRVYVHRNNKALDDSILRKVYGINVEDNIPGKSVLNQKICSECGKSNPSTHEFCDCGMPLEEAMATEMMKEKLKIAREVMKNRDFLSLLLNEMKKNNGSGSEPIPRQETSQTNVINDGGQDETKKAKNNGRSLWEWVKNGVIE